MPHKPQAAATHIHAYLPTALALHAAEHRLNYTFSAKVNSEFTFNGFVYKYEYVCVASTLAFSKCTQKGAYKCIYPCAFALACLCLCRRLHIVTHIRQVISKFDTPSGAELNFTGCLPPGSGRCCICISLYVNIIWYMYL